MGDDFILKENRDGSKRKLFKAVSNPAMRIEVILDQIDLLGTANHALKR